MVIDGEMVELMSEYDNARVSVPVIGDRHYDGNCTTDGVDISTRAKHRAYMKRTGLTTIDDFKETFKKAEEQRHRFKTEGYDPTRRRDIVRAVNRVYDRGERNGR